MVPAVDVGPLDESLPGWALTLLGGLWVLFLVVCLASVYRR